MKIPSGSKPVPPISSFVPVTEWWDWQKDAACRGMSTSTFFHPDNERGDARRHRIRAAKAVCGRCPVVEQCRRHALKVAEPYGIWGGLSEAERSGA